MRFQYKNLYSLLSCLLLLAACKKDKLDFGYDNRNVTDSRKSSNVRIVNLAGYNQVVANGDSLTSFIARAPGPDANQYPATHYFPEDGRLHKTWTIPQELFDQQERIDLALALRNYQPSFNRDIAFPVVNDYNNPTDYYLLPEFYMQGQPGMLPVSRSVTAPSKPDHFKIRIVNLTGKINSLALNSSGQQEELHGPVSLAWADGTLVNAKTTNVSEVTHVSEYIELPYGTYQFRVLSGDGRQLPGAGGGVYSHTLIDPPTSSLPVTLMQISQQVYAPIRTYQPGGIYTIVVAPQEFNFIITETGEDANTYQNSFQLIEDNSISANLTYCRIQGANALSAQPVNFRVNNVEMAKALDFGKAGDYLPVVYGTATITATDAAGTVIATAQQVLRPAQNYTAWLYPDNSGAAKILVVANDLSGSRYSGGGNGDDATFNRFQQDYYTSKRFLNLSPDEPYITFTLNNGQPPVAGNEYSAAIANLQPAVPVVEQPYVASGLNAAYELMAYRSRPDVVPGTWANDVPVLLSTDFIARREMYINAGRKLPVHEPGIFTVALIGRSGNNTPAAEKTRMIIVKHNK